MIYSNHTAQLRTPPVAATRAWFVFALLMAPALAWAPSAQASAWSAVVANCHLFNHEIQRGAHISLPAGSIQFGRATAPSVADYRAAASLRDAGNLDTRIYDCRKGGTANGLATTLSRRLRQSGYILRYQCSGRTCGPPEGWVQRLGLRATPATDGFNYLLAQRRSTNGPEAVAIYTVDLDDIPRIIVYHLDADTRLPAKIAADRARVQPLYQAANGPDASAHFAPGSARILKPEAFLSSLGEALKKPSSGLIIVGHTDTRGDAASNGPLSWRRARAVARLLHSRLGIPQLQMRLYAVAANIPASPPTPAKNRRVDIFSATVKPPADTSPGDTAVTPPSHAGASPQPPPATTPDTPSRHPPMRR